MIAIKVREVIWEKWMEGRDLWQEKGMHRGPAWVVGNEFLDLGGSYMIICLLIIKCIFYALSIVVGFFAI